MNSKCPVTTPAARCAGQLPFVTVVMPVRNEADCIERSLGAVFAQDYPPERMEVIVADGMSTDGTREIVERWARCQPGLALVDNPGGIVPTGMNAALARARGDIVVRVDGHCEIAPDYVSRCVGHLETPGVDGVGGPVETVGKTPTARAIALAMSSRFGVGDSAFRTVRETTELADTVPFPAYPRALIEWAGPYDEELVRNQDDEYNYRLRKLGARLLLAQDVKSVYYSRSSFRSLACQYFQYGLWKVRVLQKHPRQMRWRQFAPPLFAAAVLGGLTFAPFSRWGRLGLIALSVLYALAMMLGSLGAARRGGWRLLPLLPPAFATLHFAYGSGFLAGLCRFWNRWGARGSSSGGARTALEDSASL
jgi:glycosyltransferase involved in cell wall biosynthesis